MLYIVVRMLQTLITEILKSNGRPIAAHCIGYPLVSIGYCLKGYMAYLLRLRKQGEVENKNKFYYQLLHEALPPENVRHKFLFLRFIIFLVSFIQIS